MVTLSYLGRAIYLYWTSGWILQVLLQDNRIVHRAFDGMREREREKKRDIEKKKKNHSFYGSPGAWESRLASVCERSIREICCGIFVR